MAPKGRDEDGLAHPMAWVRHHDRYDKSYFVDPKAKYVAPEGFRIILLFRGGALVTTQTCCHAVSNRFNSTRLRRGSPLAVRALGA